MIKMQRNNFISIFIYKYPFPFENTNILEERQIYMDSVNPLEQRDSYYSWRLLEKAVRRVFHKELNEFNPHKLDSGKWVCDEFCFSISHSGGIVAVALSNSNIGIDLQKERGLDLVSDGRFSDKEIELIKDYNERHDYEIWTRKEALYKFLDRKIPFNRDTWKLFDTTEYKHLFKTSSFSVDGIYSSDYFYISICSEIVNTNIDVFSNIQDIKDLF